jgi:hypothetical protein
VRNTPSWRRRGDRRDADRDFVEVEGGEAAILDATRLLGRIPGDFAGMYRTLFAASGQVGGTAADMVFVLR